MGVQPVRVDQERRLDPLGDGAGELERVLVAPQARAQDDGGSALCRLEDGLGRARGQAALRPRETARHDLGQLHLEDRLQVGGHRHRGVAGAHPDRRLRRHAHGARQAPGAAHHQHLAGIELGRARLRRGARPSTASAITPAAGSPGAPAGIPISATRSSPVWAFPGAIQCPSLARWKVTVTSASHRRSLDLAGRGVDAGGDVGRHDRGPAAVDRLDRGVRGRARRPREPGAEDRVHNHPGSLERRRDLPRARLGDGPPNRSRLALASGESSAAGHSRSASTS